MKTILLAISFMFCVGLNAQQLWYGYVYNYASNFGNGDTAVIVYDDDVVFISCLIGTATGDSAVYVSDSTTTTDGVVYEGMTLRSSESCGIGLSEMGYINYAKFIFYGTGKLIFYKRSRKLL